MTILLGDCGYMQNIRKNDNEKNIPFFKYLKVNSQSEVEGYIPFTLPCNISVFKPADNCKSNITTYYWDNLGKMGNINNFFESVYQNLSDKYEIRMIKVNSLREETILIPVIISEKNDKK